MKKDLNGCLPLLQNYRHIRIFGSVQVDPYCRRSSMSKGPFQRRIRSQENPRRLLGHLPLQSPPPPAEARLIYLTDVRTTLRLVQWGRIKREVAGRSAIGRLRIEPEAPKHRCHWSDRKTGESSFGKLDIASKWMMNLSRSALSLVGSTSKDQAPGYHPPCQNAY